MIKIFKLLIGHTVEVYIDNIVVKSKTRSEHAQHLEETFRLMKMYNMKLNPDKCVFGVNVGKFLGFMVTQRGIEVSPDQINVVMETSAPSSKKELQCFTGHLAALGRFIARFTDKLRPIFLTLKGTSATGWTNNYEQAFGEIKHYLPQPPILSSPKPSEQLYMYLAIYNYVVSVVLFRHEKDKEQRPIYYVRKSMVDTETRYSKMEQTTLAFKSVAQKLRPYFQVHKIDVLMNQQLRSILHKPNLSGRMLRWAIELSEYRIKCQPIMTMKGQVMANFIAEIPQKSSQLAGSLNKEWWILHVDGASRVLRFGIGLLLQSPTKERLEGCPTWAPCI